MTVAAPLEIREMRDEDLPALLCMWEETGWENLPEEHWAARHRHGPHGASRVVVAVDHTGAVVGQVTAMRTTLNVHGCDVPAARLHGAILSLDHRRRRGRVALAAHPLLGMLYALRDPLVRDGVVVVYVLPDDKLLPLLRYFPETERAEMPLWSSPVDRFQTAPVGHQIVPVLDPEEVDALWVRCREGLVCTTRDARTLAWKRAFGPLQLHGVRRDGELVAVVATRESGEPQLMLDDLLAVDRDAQAAAIAAVVRIARQRAEHRDMRKVGILAAPILRPALVEAGFTVDDYVFTLLVHRLDSHRSADLPGPAQWYLSAND